MKYFDKDGVAIIIMTMPDLLKQRICNQQIGSYDFSTPHDLVAWFGAMQAQEYDNVKCAIGLRLPGITCTAVERDFIEKKLYEPG